MANLNHNTSESAGMTSGVLKNSTPVISNVPIKRKLSNNQLSPSSSMHHLIMQQYGHQFEQLSYDRAQQLYSRYSRQYSATLRNSMDVNFTDKSRYILWGLLLAVVLFYFGFVARPPQNVSESVRLGIGALFCAILIYCVLLTKESLTSVNPIPSIWRVVHAVCLLHFLFMVALLVQPPDTGRDFMKVVFPELASHKSKNGEWMSTCVFMMEAYMYSCRHACSGLSQRTSRLLLHLNCE